MNFYTSVALSLMLALTCANPLQKPDKEGAAVEGSECALGCPRILNPICATDGADNFQYFHNECLMRFEGCRTGTVWSETRMSLCLPQVDPIIREECLRPCPFNYDPICATNGQSHQAFGNECVFGIENCLTNGKWIVVHKSECGF